MSNLKGQEATASQFKPHGEEAAPNIFGEYPEENLSTSADLVKLQSAITDLAAALIELDVTHKTQGSAILREGLNATLSSSKVLRSTFFKGILDAADLTFIDELIKGVIENGRSGYKERSAFRKAVLALVKKYSDELHYRSTFYPYDQDGLIERRAQLTSLLRADIAIPYPDRKAPTKFSNAYPDEDFIKVVEDVLSSGKRYYALFLDTAFNTFLDDLHELNKERNAKKLFAHTETPFSSKETLLDLVRILAVAYNRCSKDIDAFYSAFKRDKNSAYLLTHALVDELKYKLAISNALLSEEQLSSYVSAVQQKGLRPKDDNESSISKDDNSTQLKVTFLTGDQSRIIRAEAAALWEEMEKRDHLSYQAAMKSHRLLSIVQQDKDQLDVDMARLTRELASAELQLDAASKENETFRAKNAELVLANESAELEHQAEMTQMREFFSKQLEFQTMMLVRLQSALEKIGNKDSQALLSSSECADQSQEVFELQKHIRLLEQQNEQLKQQLANKYKSRRCLFVGSDSEDTSTITKESEQKVKAHVDTPARFNFNSEDGEESSSNTGDAKLVGSFTPEKSSLSCE